MGKMKRERKTRYNGGEGKRRGGGLFSLVVYLLYKTNTRGKFWPKLFRTKVSRGSREYSDPQVRSNSGLCCAWMEHKIHIDNTETGVELVPN